MDRRNPQISHASLGIREAPPSPWHSGGVLVCRPAIWLPSVRDYFLSEMARKRRVRIAPDAQALFWRRRHQPRRPPLANAQLAEQARDCEHKSSDPQGQASKQRKVAQEKKHATRPCVTVLVQKQK